MFIIIVTGTYKMLCVEMVWTFIIYRIPGTSLCFFLIATKWRSISKKAQILSEFHMARSIASIER